eukprot:TRINITY_DN39557_c0_g1_i1.p1 TRINITY_DN39557_c0_g1~~TRINITY_DN39557_c0_g1_i1.p1  ORF type:complete len:939 (+),score=241.27 TRINITY_DN39557_c0_g1_i1:239-3055(+)
MALPACRRKRESPLCLVVLLAALSVLQSHARSPTAGRWQSEVSAGGLLSDARSAGGARTVALQQLLAADGEDAQAGESQQQERKLMRRAGSKASGSDPLKLADDRDADIESPWLSKNTKLADDRDDAMDSMWLSKNSSEQTAAADGAANGTASSSNASSNGSSDASSSSASSNASGSNASSAASSNASSNATNASTISAAAEDDSPCIDLRSRKQAPSVDFTECLVTNCVDAPPDTVLMRLVAHAWSLSANTCDDLKSVCHHKQVSNLCPRACKICEAKVETCEKSLGQVCEVATGCGDGSQADCVDGDCICKKGFCSMNGECVTKQALQSGGAVGGKKAAAKPADTSATDVEHDSFGAFTQGNCSDFACPEGTGAREKAEEILCPGSECSSIFCCQTKCDATDGKNKSSQYPCACGFSTCTGHTPYCKVSKSVCTEHAQHKHQRHHHHQHHRHHHHHGASNNSSNDSLTGQGVLVRRGEAGVATPALLDGMALLGLVACAAVCIYWYLHYHHQKEQRRLRLLRKMQRSGTTETDADSGSDSNTDSSDEEAAPSAKAAAAKRTGAAAPGVEGPLPVEYEPPPPKPGIDKQTELKAALRIQAHFRGWKARKHVTAKHDKGGKRFLKDKQRFALFVMVQSASGLPSVKMFGGIDPHLELRCVSGVDPARRNDGGIASPPKFSVSTQTKKGETEPKWGETLLLDGFAKAPDHFLQVILWDSGMTGKTAVGSVTLAAPECLGDADYDPGRNGPLPACPKKLKKFKNLHDPSMSLKTAVSLSLSWVEVHRYSIKLQKASRLPKVKMIGTINSLIEIRICKKDPRKSDYVAAAGPDLVAFSGRCDAVPNSMDPKYDKEISFETPGHPLWFLQLILIDDASPMPETPLAQAVIPLYELGETLPFSMGGKQIDHKLRFSKLPGADLPAEIRKSKLSVAIGYDTVMA